MQKRRKKGMTARIALSLLNNIIEVQKKNPKISKRVDKLQKELAAKMEVIYAELQGLDERGRELMTVSVINFIHDKADEIFLETEN